MSSFGDLSAGIQILSKELMGRVRLTGAVDFYQRKLGYAWSTSNGTSLDNFSYIQYSLGINIKF
jgi:hypothetical protein